MKHLLSLCAALLLATTSLLAQSAKPQSAAVALDQSADEVRAMSGQLKEAHGLVSREIAVLDREIGPDATKATAEQAQHKEQLKTSLAQLEGMLTAVNSGDKAQWAETKTKAEAIRAEALGLVKSRKAEK
ncbi:MAG: hypothetical protein IPM46_03160 [Flavobacteriales bacterium]|nr:hypothetical protein [Flavobacteriales bacterium]